MTRRGLGGSPLRREAPARSASWVGHDGAVPLLSAEERERDERIAVIADAPGHRIRFRWFAGAALAVALVAIAGLAVATSRRGEEQRTPARPASEASTRPRELPTSKARRAARPIRRRDSVGRERVVARPDRKANARASRHADRPRSTKPVQPAPAQQPVTSPEPAPVAAPPPAQPASPVEESPPPSEPAPSATCQFSIECAGG